MDANIPSLIEVMDTHAHFGTGPGLT